MVEAAPNTKHKIRLLFDNCRVELALENTLSPHQQMTGLKYAIDHMKELLNVSQLRLMFDEDNPTNEEEILEQGITDVLIKQINQMNIADMILMG